MSGFSKNDLNHILRQALEPNFRKLLCAIEAVSTAIGGSGDPVTSGTATPSLTSSTGAGSTTAGAYEVSISNIGGSAGVVDGVAFPAGASVSFSSQMDRVNNQFKALTALSYDATGTTFLIAETV
jgi:hypothetical protein